MNKHKKMIGAIAFLALGTASLSAGSVDTKSNLSTGYLRNPSRNTEDSRPEAVLYNLAGTGFLEQGFHAEVGNQFVFKTYSDELGGTTYEDNEVVLLYPNIDMVYRFGDFAVSASFQINGGGGTLDYEDGTGLTAALLSQFGVTSHEVEVSSITYGQTLGFAYNLNDTVSFAAGIRFLEATQEMSLSSNDTTWLGVNGDDDTSYEAFGWGVGGIFGVHYKPIPKLDLALQYKTITKMKMKFDEVEGNALTAMGIAEGEKFNNDLPSEINAGVGYQLLDSLYLSTSFNYYFNSHADIGSALSDEDLDWDDSWEIGAGVDWQLTDKILLSTGTLYSKQGCSDDVNNLFAPVLDSLTFAGGVEYKMLKQLTLTYGAMYTMYKDTDYTDSTTGQTFELDKDVFQMALSLTYNI